MDETDVVDIYGDLPNIELGTEIERLQKECDAHNAKTAELLSKIDLLNEEKKILEEQRRVLQNNISISLKTARRELKRKEKIISELRDQVAVLRNQKQLVASTKSNLLSTASQTTESSLRPIQPKQLNPISTVSQTCDHKHCHPKRPSSSTASQTTDSYVIDCPKLLKEVDNLRRHQSPDSSKVIRENKNSYRDKDEYTSREGRSKSANDSQSVSDVSKESSRNNSTRFDRSRLGAIPLRERLQRKRGRDDAPSSSYEKRQERFSSRESNRDARGGTSVDGGHGSVKGRINRRSRSPVHRRGRSRSPVDRRSRSISPRSGRRRRQTFRGDDRHHPEESKRPRIEYERSPTLSNRNRRHHGESHLSRDEDPIKDKINTDKEDSVKSCGKQNTGAKLPAKKLQSVVVYNRASYERELDSAEEAELIDGNVDRHKCSLINSEEQKQGDSVQNSSSYASAVSRIHDTEEIASQEKDCESIPELKKNSKRVESTESYETALDFEEDRELEDEPQDQAAEGEVKEVEEGEYISGEDDDYDHGGGDDNETASYEEINWQLEFSKRKPRRYGPEIPTLYTQRMTQKLKAENDLSQVRISLEKAVSMSTEENLELANEIEDRNKVQASREQGSQQVGCRITDNNSPERAFYETPGLLDNTKNMEAKVSECENNQAVVISQPSDNYKSRDGGTAEDENKEAESVLNSLCLMVGLTNEKGATVPSMPTVMNDTLEIKQILEGVVLPSRNEKLISSIPGVRNLTSSKTDNTQFNHNVNNRSVMANPPNSSVPIEYTPFKNNYKLIEISPILPKPGISVLAYYEQKKRDEEAVEELEPGKLEKPIILVPVLKPSKPLMPTDILNFIVDSEETPKNEKTQGLPESIATITKEKSKMPKEHSLLFKGKLTDNFSPTIVTACAVPEADSLYKKEFNASVSEMGKRRSPRKPSKPVKRPIECKDADSEHTNSVTISETVSSRKHGGFTNYRIPKLKKSSSSNSKTVTETSHSSRILLDPGDSEEISRKTKHVKIKCNKNDKQRERGRVDNVKFSEELATNMKDNGNKSGDAKHNALSKKCNLLSRRNSKSSSDKSRERKEVRLSPLKIVSERKDNTRRNVSNHSKAKEASDSERLKGSNKDLCCQSSDGKKGAILQEKLMKKDANLVDDKMNVAANKKSERSRKRSPIKNSHAAVVTRTEKKTSAKDPSCRKSAIMVGQCIEAIPLNQSELSSSSSRIVMQESTQPSNLSLSSASSMSTTPSSTFSNSNLTADNSKLETSESNVNFGNSKHSNDTEGIANVSSFIANGGGSLQCDLHLSESSESENDEPASDDGSDSGASDIVSRLFGAD